MLSNYLINYFPPTFSTCKEISLYISLVYWCFVAIAFVAFWARTSPKNQCFKLLIVMLLDIILPVILWCIL